MNRKQDCCSHAESNLYDKRVFVKALTRVLGNGHGVAGKYEEQPLQCCLCSAAGERTSHWGCGHVLAVDTDRLELYCRLCRDYMYLQEFDEALLLVKHQLVMQQPEKSSAKHCYIPNNDPATSIQAKRQKLKDAAESQRRNSSSSSSSTCLAPAQDGVADIGLTAADIDGAEAVLSCVAAGSCSAVHAGDGFPVGLRGLNNLGNTCFMNSVIQVMLHAPLLSSFFLGEGHNPTTCWLTARDRPCLACQMDAIFAEMYSGSRAPFSPSEFLYHWWRHADSLAGYQQQDAHEFYLSLLEGMSAATIATQQQQDKQQTAAGDIVAPKLQQSPVGAQAGTNTDNAVGDSALLLQRFTAGAAAHEGGGAGLDVLGRPTAAAAAHQIWVQQQQQLALGLHGGLDLQLPGSTADWQQFTMQQLLQQHGLHGWAQGYGFADMHNSHQQQQDGHMRCAGPSVTPEPCTADGTPEPEPQGHPDGGEGLVELLFSGLLRSDVRCCACGHTSTAHDPFRDISLDLHVPRPPKLPPAQPHHRTQGALTALAAKAAALASQQQQTVDGLAGSAAATPQVVSPAPHGAAAAADSSCVSGGGVLGREVTPPLLLVTPSPTPPPSELLGDFWDNADDDAATVAAGQLGSSRPQSPTAGPYSATTRLGTKPESPSVAAAAAGGGGIHEGVSSDGGGSLGVDGTSQLSPAGDVSTGTSLSARECAVSDLAAVSGPTAAAAAADQFSGQDSLCSTDASELGGAAASQSSQQMGPADTSVLTGSGFTRDTTPEPASTTDTAAAAEASHNTPQHQQCAGAGANRESTPQSQQHPPPAVQDCHQQQNTPAVALAAGQDGAGVAPSLVRGVDGGLGQLVRAPIAAIKQLLPEWPAPAHHQQQQQQRPAGTGDHYADGVGDCMGALPQQRQQQVSAGVWRSADLQEWQQQQQQLSQQQQHGKVRLSSVDPFPSGSASAAGRARGSKRGAAAAGHKARQQRCGSCKYCLNRHLKKGCEANKKLLEEAKKTAAAPTHHPQQQHNTGATSAGVAGLRTPVAPSAPSTCAVLLGGPDSAATQPSHPLGGLYATQLQQQQYQQQQQQEQHQQNLQQQQQQEWQQQRQQQQHVPHQPDWLSIPQTHTMQQVPDHWQQHQHQQSTHQQTPLAAPSPAAQKVRRSTKPGSSTTELLAAAALQQGLMKKRDDRGRFYRKEDLQVWALQLYEEGRLSVQGMPAVSQQAAAAARARGLPEPPAALAARTAAAAAVAAPHAGPWVSGTVAATSAAGVAGAAAKASKPAGVRKGSAASGCNATAIAAAAKKQAPPPPQLRMNELSLAGCLRRFVRPERLGPAAHWRCSGCGSTAAALKQMSIRRLPLVLCFHMKRFEHGGAAGRAKKLDVPMKFPLNGLDMAPFTTSEALTAGHSNVTSRVAAGADRAAITGGGPSPGGADSSVAYEQPTATTLAGVSYQQQCLYELFGVVSHSGDMASGHYVSYVKCEGCWYLINDPWVVAVAEAHVAAAQAYMLFYAQEHLFGTGASSGLGTAAAAATGNTVMHIKQEPTVAHSGELATTAQTVVKPDPTAVAGVAAARLGNKLGATAGDQPLASADAEVLLEQQSSNKAMGLMADSPVAGW